MSRAGPLPPATALTVIRATPGLVQCSLSFPDTKVGSAEIPSGPVSLRDLDAEIGQVREALPMLVERKLLLYADFRFQAGCALDLHQKLVGVDRSPYPSALR